MKLRILSRDMPVNLVDSLESLLISPWDCRCCRVLRSCLQHIHTVSDEIEQGQRELSRHVNTQSAMDDGDRFRSRIPRLLTLPPWIRICSMGHPASINRALWPPYGVDPSRVSDDSDLRMLSL
ncbi:hypothetical protein U1Q18_003919 [Sarracenia purpurea var. burkii]